MEKKNQNQVDKKKQNRMEKKKHNQMEKNKQNWMEKNKQNLMEMNKHFSQVMWLLLIQEADCYRDSEMWFVVNGIPIQFSLMEYALISGLKCSKYAKGWKSQAESKLFKDRHFRERPSCILIDDLKTKLKQLSDKTKRKNHGRRMKLTMKY
ncbi:hypothetical protein CsatB_017742 [Cannabis sativa]|uniref:uncharacterized protein LOC115710430 n=1 Tax=Cannabis sativa TaxID=3483 RepID=UPI0011DF9B1A|nr:uncharacterized protein LOC115710430 [Cannabis sativa]